MNKVRIVIIDDEKNVRIVIKKLLGLLSSEYIVVGEAPSVVEGKKVILETKPEIVLLDIELEDGSGFSLLNQLPRLDFKLIFITAYNQYAIKAFKYSALDYLLKPVEPTDLKNAIDRAKERIQSENELKKLLQNFEDPKHSKIVVKMSNGTHFINIEDILYCQADGSYAKVITKNGTIFASKNLKHFEDLLEEKSFIRTHQSYLVNKAEIAAIKHNFAVLKNNTRIPISIRRKPEITALLKG